MLKIKHFHYIIITLSAVFSGFVLSAGIKHNPMGTFCRHEILDPCTFDYAYAAVIWLSWFIPAASILEVVFLAVVWLRRSVLR